MKKQAMPYLVLFIALNLWALSYPLTKIMVAQLTDIKAAYLRTLLYAAACLPLLLNRKIYRLPRVSWRFVCFAGAVGVGLHYLLLNIGSASFQSGEISLLMSTTPLFALILGSGVYRFSTRSLTACFLGLIGSAVVVGLKPFLALQDKLFDAFLLLGAAFCGAVFTYCQKRASVAMTPWQFTAFTGTIAGIAVLITYPAIIGVLMEISLISMIYLLILAIVCSMLAMVASTFAYKRLPFSLCANSLYLIGPLSFLWGWILLKEIPNPRSIGGGIIIIAAVALLVTPREMKPTKLDESRSF